MPYSYPGVFIVIEGVEGSGKSTQCQLLKAKLSSLHIPAIVTREPGGTRTGEQVRQWLREGSDLNRLSELFLFSAARVALLEQVIVPELHRGSVVILDRYIYSTIAYQGFAKGCDRIDIDSINKIATDNLQPNLAFLLDIPPKESFKRKSCEEPDRFEQEDLSFHDLVRAGYKSIASQDSKLWTILDASESINTVHDKIWRRVTSSNAIGNNKD